MAGDDTMQRFLAKLRDILRGKVKDGDLSASDFDSAVHQAAGHVGGIARAEKAREDAEAKTFPYQSPDDLPEDVAKALPSDAQAIWMAAYNSAHKQHPDDEARCAQTAWAAVKRAGYGKDDKGLWKKVAAEGSTMGRLGFLAPVELAEDKATGKVQIFPRAGSYAHPEYGDIKIDGAFLKEVKRNFDAKIYQQELPLTIDLEHQTQLSGAAGWITSLEVHGNDGLWATVEFNERGKELVGADAFRYFSPTYYDEWQDPATGKQYRNVLVGGALTNRPFFKGMEPVLMSAGEGLYCFVEPIKDAEDDISIEDNSTLSTLNEYLQAFGSFEDEEVEGLSASALDAAIEAIDELSSDATEADEFAGGHAGHTGHKGHGGGSTGEMGYASKKAARTRVMKQLNGDRTGLLRELKTLRTMKLHSPAATGMRKGMIKEAQKALAGVRAKMIAARAKYRSEPNIGAKEADMDMMACMQQMMAMMGQMTKMMPDEAKGKADAMMAKAEGMIDEMKKQHPDAHPSPGERSDRQAMIEQFLSENRVRVQVQAGQIGAEAVRAQLLAIGASEAETSTVLTSLGLDTKGGASMGMNDDEARQFKELSDGFKALSTKVEAAEARASKAEADLRTANETISAMSRTEKRRELSEFVRGNRFAFQGEVDACVDKLEKLRDQLDADTFKELLEEKRTMSERVRSSGMFEQIGTGKAAAGSITAQFDAAIKGAEASGIKGAEAIAKVARENPDLYRRYNDEHNSRTRQGGA